MHTYCTDRFELPCHRLTGVLFFIYFTRDIHNIYERIWVIIIINYANGSPTRLCML